MSRSIFLHEFIDIVGQGAWPYMEHTKGCSGEEANGLELHELSEVRPGAALDYLGAMQEEWAPVAREYGLKPVGLYEVLMSDTEVVSVWAGNVDAVVKLGRTYDACRGLDDSVDADDRVLRWRRRAREYTTRWREELMTPCPGTLCCPDGSA